MRKRSFLKKSILLGILGLGGLTSKGRTMQKPKNVDGNFIHHVYFWLKEPDNEEANQKFLKELTTFIDQGTMIRSKHIGKPADTSRPVIDSSYSYSLMVTFDTKADHDEYQAFQPHKTFIANAEHLWERVLVYDSVLL